MDGLDISSLLPPSLLLPPRLSAHKYLMVCTLTVAAWDTLVLSPRTWRLMKTKEWPFLKITYQILRHLMPVEFTVVAVAFFDSKWSLERCQQFYLFEPICTAVLMCVASASLAVRLYAIFEQSKMVMGVLGSLLFFQVVVQAICCGFYQVVPLDVGQGCIAGPKHVWVGLYWLAPTMFYTAALALAVLRSIKSQAVKPINVWRLFLRDGINLYAAIWIVNVINTLFWFTISPRGPSDSIRTIITSMAAVLTTTMTLRVILGVRGTLVHGGVYSGMTSLHGSSNPSSSRQNPANVQHQLSAHNAVGRTSGGAGRDARAQYTIEEIQAKAAKDWSGDNASDHDDMDRKSPYVIEHEAPGLQRGLYGEKATLADDAESERASRKAGGIGVKVTMDREFK